MGSGSSAGGCLLATVLCVACGPARAPSAASLSELRRVPLGSCEDYPEESRSLVEVRRDLELLDTLGIDVLRVSIGWDEVEPEKDHYDFSFWDAFVELAVGSGVRLLPYVAYTPRWNSSSEADDFWRAPPRDLDEFEEVLALLAGRYRGRVHSWEIWNEPDNRDYWLGTAAEYAALLERGASGVRRSDPHAQVVFGGLAGGIEFLRALFDEHGAAQYVDVVNLHAYYETWNPDPVETIDEYVDEASRIVRRHAGRSELWMAEVGYSNYQAPASAAGSGRFSYEHSLEFQAVMLVRTLALVLAKPALSLVAWYELKDARSADAVIGDAHNRHLGVAFADYRPKPAYDALAFMNRLFASGARSIDGELSFASSDAPALSPAPTGVEVHAWLTARHSLILIAWLPTHPSAPGAGQAVADPDLRREQLRVSLPYAPRGEAAVYDARGRPRPDAARLRRELGAAELELEVRGGDVQIVELPVAAER